MIRDDDERRAALDRVKLGQTIRRVRKERNLSQQELGDLLGITNVAVSHFERGTSMPSVFTFVDIARALGVSYGVLFSEPLATAEHAVAQVRAEIRALGYDIALIPREDA